MAAGSSSGKLESELAIYSNVDNPDKFEYYKKILSEKRTEHNLCSGLISKGFLEDSLEDTTYLILHFFNGIIRGFACVQLKNDAKLGNYFYIDLICNTSFHKMITRSRKDATYLSGKNMLELIKRLAILKKIRYIKLNALDHVITYYYHLGYRFMQPGLEKEVSDEIVSKLRRALKEGYDEDAEKILDTIVRKYYPGFYSEKTQYELASIPIDERKEIVREDGIPMLLEVPLISEDTILKKGGRKNKRKRRIKKRTIKKKKKSNHRRKYKKQKKRVTRKKKRR